MNDHSLTDPELQFLEERLAATVPQISPLQQQEMLYRCAFAAGQQVAASRLRRWQVGTAAFVVLLSGLSISRAINQVSPVKRNVEPIAATDGAPQQIVTPPEIPAVARQSAKVELDAWQMQQQSSAALANELDRFERNDSHLRSLAMGTLARAILHP